MSCSAPPEGDGSGASARTAGTASEAPGTKSVESTAISSEVALATFDAAWTRIHDTDFDESHGGVDWNAVRDELRPAAATATNQSEIRGVIHKMLERLGRSHFALIPWEISDPDAMRASSSGDRDAAKAPDASVTDSASSGTAATAPTDGKADDAASEHATFGLRLRVVAGEVTVVDVSPGSAAADAGVQRGWSLRRIDGFDVSAAIAEAMQDDHHMNRFAAEHFAEALDSGRTGERQLLFAGVDGTEHALRLERRPSTARRVKVGSLPPMELTVDSHWIDDETLARAGASGARIGYLAFSVWLPEAGPAIDRGLDELRGAEGIIIDLRGNPGGFGGMVMGTGGHFVTEPISIGSMITRDTTMEFVLNPRRATRDGRVVEPIAAPLAILIDPLSASTSEIFAGGLKDIGRARIFGQASAGAALPAQMFKLPNGDILLHAFADFRVPSGAALEGAGVTPDEPRTLTRSDIAQEGDPVLLDAVRWIRTAASSVR